MVVAHVSHIVLFDYRLGRCQLLSEVLEELGYRVSIVADAREARRALTDRDVDLLIASVPRAGGDEHNLAEYAASLRIPCVLMSDIQEVRRSFGEESATFVDKSFTLRQFADEVLTILPASRIPAYGR
jgi:DNA-binding NtrC family response regulator